MRWPGRPYAVVSFLGGCSFLGFHFIPTWLMAPLFFVTPAAGPMLLLLIGLLCMGRARQTSETLTASRLVAVTLVGCALVLLPVALFDLLFFGTVPYIGPLILLVAVPFHVVCVGVFAAGLYAVSKAEDNPAHAGRLAAAAAAGLAVGVAVTGVRYAIVPQSRGVFLEAFSASGAALRLTGKPLDPYGQRDVQATLGAKPRSFHEPVAAIGDDGLWIARRSTDAACSGYWIERKAIAAGGSEWRRCLPVSPGLTRNPAAMARDSSSGVFVIGFDVRDGRESWWLERFDAGGVEDPRWNKSFPAVTKIDRAYGMSLARDGSVYVSGESGDINLPGTSGWLRKFGPDGNEIRDGWNKQFPNAGERRPTMAAVAVTTEAGGDVYVLLDLYTAHSVRKFDADGHDLWQRELPFHKDLAIVAAGSGGVFISGAAGYPDQAWLKKLNADGSDAWERTFTAGHLSSTLAVATDGANVYAAGYGTEPTDKASYWWVKKLSADGRSETWQATLSGPNNDNSPFQLHFNANGELYVLGSGRGWQFSKSRLERYWGW